MTAIKTYDHGVAWEEGNGVTQGYAVNGTIYVSGQFSHNMQGEFVGEGDIEVQTKQTLENIDRVLEGFGVSRSNLAYMEIYLTNTSEHAEPALRIFKECMGEHRPAGTLLGVTSLAFPEQLIEISAIAHAN